MPLFPILSAVVLAALVSYFWITDHVMRSAALFLAPLVWLLLLALWWIGRGRGRRWLRLVLVVVSFFVMGALCRLIFRYEGSADGSAWPSLAFRWAKPTLNPLKPATMGESMLPQIVVAPDGAAEMPRFLGIKGDGILPEATFDTDWAAHPPREAWRIPVGAGWSGFAVSGGRAITQEQRGDMECVTCYEVASGRLLWMHEDKAQFSELMGGLGPRATPTIDSVTQRVFTLGGTGLLNCLDLQTGARIWLVDVLKEAGGVPNLEWGKSSSPLLTTQHVICSGGSSGPSLLAFDRQTGRLAWTSGKEGGSYASPVLLQLDGKEQIITVSQKSASGHHPTTGKEFWHFDWLGTFPKVAQPVQISDQELLITSSYGVKSHLLQIQNSQVTVKWADSSPRTKFSSASLFGTHIYALDEGTLCCVDLRDGNRVWREGRYGFGQQIRVGNGLLLIQTEKGPVVLVKPDANKLIELARLDSLKGKTWNPPTLAGRWLLLRHDHEAVCYELSSSHPLSK